MKPCEVVGATPPIAGLEKLTLDEDIDEPTPDANSPTDLMLDAPEEHIVEPNGAESDDVAIIDPDAMDTDELRRADDCGCTPPSPLPASSLTLDAVDAMKAFVLPPLSEEPRILDDQVNTWTIEGWRTLNKKEHGPTFEAGGSPW